MTNISSDSLTLERKQMSSSESHWHNCRTGCSYCFCVTGIGTSTYDILIWIYAKTYCQPYPAHCTCTWRCFFRWFLLHFPSPLLPPLLLLLLFLLLLLLFLLRLLSFLICLLLLLTPRLALSCPSASTPRLRLALSANNNNNSNNDKRVGM